MLLGEFLLQKNVIDEAALLGALDEQQRRKCFLGTLGVQEGLLSVSDVLRVVNAQIGDRRSFGAVAIGLGALDEDGIDRLLALQRASVEPLGELLVERGSLEAGKLQEMLDEYFEASRTEL